MTNQKTSNFSLSQELEAAREKLDEFLVEKENLQNQIERTAYAHAEEKIKLESTLAQQTKLIDFLNAKVIEETPKGKKGKVSFAFFCSTHKRLTRGLFMIFSFLCYGVAISLYESDIVVPFPGLFMCDFRCPIFHLLSLIDFPSHIQWFFLVLSGNEVGQSSRHRYKSAGTKTL